ncbi:MAG: tagatose 1,6-diphosphate aldolase [Terriglobia bacterium]
MKITAGKLKRISAVADSRGVIAAAAMDQRGSLQKSLAKEKGTDVSAITPQMMSDFKSAVTRILTPHATAILLDPEFGLDAVKVKAPNAGVLLAYEQTGYDHTLPGRIPSLIPYWTVKKAIEAGADCLKLLLYYSPFESQSVKDMKHAFVARIGAECHFYEMPFFLEFVGYDPDGGDEKGIAFAKRKPEIVARSMEEFSKPEYGVDVLKVEIPVNMEFVEGSKANKTGQVAYTRQEAKAHYVRAAELAKLPFIYLSAGVSDEVFRESLELGIEAGTQFAGVLCGRATWKDGIPVFAKQGLKAFEDWLNDRGVRNIKALNEVLKGAHPWHAKYGGLSKLERVDKAGNPVK